MALVHLKRIVIVTSVCVSCFLNPELLSNLLAQSAPAAEEPVAQEPASQTPDKPARPPRRFNGYASVAIADIPHVKQKSDFCGEACAEMWLSKLGFPIDQDDVYNQSGLDPVTGRGCFTRELSRALTGIGFRTGTVWYQVAAATADRDLESRFRELHTDLQAGIPSIVCMHYDDSPETTEHFRLVVGYDSKTDEILYHEPALARGAYRRMSSDQFVKLWPLKYDQQRWTIIRFRMQPGAIQNIPEVNGFTDADYAQQVIRLKRLAPDDFSFVIQRPFVVLGDGGSDNVRRWASGTIRWAVEHLKTAYFPKEPDEILAIWLFKDKESYNKNVEAIFGDKPDTPFGYYSHRDRALIMNIDTGGGTLVHEIVHPFMASNFPRCPSWFNEGLASLYEQCGDNRGRIWGYTNWRLEGLQEAIRPPVEEPAEETDADEDDDAPETPPPPRPELPSFRELCGTTTYEFYSEDPGTNYAQARYLCYYLQQRGLLSQYYQQFRKNAADDSGGYETLKSVLGVEDEAGMEKFQKIWQDWILTLRYP